MPIYVYRCPSGHTIELLQPLDAPAPDSCDECGQGPLEKVLAPPLIKFHGSGFYSTDYGRAGTGDG